MAAEAAEAREEDVVMSDPQMSMAATAAVSPSDYLQPAAATTQDSQPSPLALLAATCSKIGPPAVEAAVTPPAPPQPTPRKLVPIKPAPLPLSPCKNSFSILSSKGNILQIQGSQLSTSYPGGQFVFAIQNPTLINKGSRSNASIQYQVPQIQGNSSQTIQVQPSLTNQIQVIPGTNQAITTPSTSGHKPVPIKPAPVQKSSTTTTPVQSGANVVKLTGGGSNMTLTLPLNNLVNTSDIGGPAQLLTESPPTPLSKTNKKARKKSLPVSQPSVAVAEQVETVLIETTADNIIQAGNNLLIVQSPGGGQPAVVQQVQVVPPKAEQQQVVQIPQQALRVVQAASATLPTVPQKPSQNFQIQTTEPTPTQVYIRTPSGEVQTVLVQDSPPATAATTSTVTCNSPALRAPHLSGTSKKTFSCHSPKRAAPAKDCTCWEHHQPERRTAGSSCSGHADHQHQWCPSPGCACHHHQHWRAAAADRAERFWKQPDYQWAEPHPDPAADGAGSSRRGPAWGETAAHGLHVSQLQGWGEEVWGAGQEEARVPHPGLREDFPEDILAPGPRPPAHWRAALCLQLVLLWKEIHSER